jgi:spore maturation protein A
VLNKIWFALLMIGIAYGFIKGAWQSAHPRSNPPSVAAVTTPNAKADAADPNVPEDALGLAATGKKLNEAVFEAAKSGAELSIGMIGFMALWLGMLNIAKDAGMVDALARALGPLTRWLFPQIPPGHPAEGAILMNLSANMLGLDNAATPLGLKAMRELQELNPVKDTATDSMAMFLAINTSSITLVPFTLLSYRVLKGSLNPAEPVAGTILATLVSTVFAIVITRWLSRWKRYQVEPPPTTVEAVSVPAAHGGNS